MKHVSEAIISILESLIKEQQEHGEHADHDQIRRLEQAIDLIKESTNQG